MTSNDKSLPGNPHVEAATTRQIDPDYRLVDEAHVIAAAIRNQASATLALAHEQRTTNLIEWSKEDVKAHPDEIARRLGLLGDETAGDTYRPSPTEIDAAASTILWVTSGREWATLGDGEREEFRRYAMSTLTSAEMARRGDL